jgi:hypothetical protein
MKLLSLLGAAVLAAIPSLHAAEKYPGIPEDYKLIYTQEFLDATALKDFAFTDPTAWKVAEADGKHVLELHQQSKYKPVHRSPFNIALLAGQKFGDCIIEAHCLQTGKEYGHRDMVVVFGFQNPSQFYYTHIATAADDHANNVFIVKDAPRVKIATETNTGNDWGLNVWHKVRVERKASDGTIKVFFDDMAKPIMVAHDKNFGVGWVGFGSFDDTGRIANVRIWAKESVAERAPEFPKESK